MKKIVLFFQLLLSGYSIYGQTILPHFETLSVNDGLSQSSVYSILQDREGFMWFGTSDGLNRYDGGEIKIFKFSGDIKDSFNSNYVGKMCEDADGNIWYSNETGIYYYDRLNQKIEQSRPFSKTEFPSTYLDIVTIEKDVIYLENILTGIVAYNTKTKALTRYSFPNQVNIFNSYDHPISYPATTYDNKIWVRGLLTKGLYIFDLVSKKFTPYLLNQQIAKIVFGQHNKYLINPDKIYVLNANNKFIDTIQYAEKGKSTHYYNVVEDRYQHLWIITINNGIIMYEPASKKFFSYQHENSKENSLPIDGVRVIYNDNNNNLWIGTDGGGVCRLDIKPKKFNQFPLNQAEYPFMNDYFTKCIYDDEKGNIYFGSFSNGLCILNKTTGVLKQFKNIPGNSGSIHANTVSAIFGDADNNIWVASSMGISIFKDGVFRRIHIKNMPLIQQWNNLVNHFYQLNNGDVVAAARSGIIYFKKKGGSIKGYYNLQKGFEIADIVEAADHQIWIGCPGNGLQHIDVTADTIIIHEKYFPGSNIRSIHLDERNPDVLWLCTVKGLIRFYCRSKKFRVYDQQDGMANTYVYGALEDGMHNLWLSTNSGISYFNRNNESFKNYNVKDGLQSNEFNSGSYFKSASGTLYFGGIKGFNWFKPSPVVADRSAPLLGITDVSIDDESILSEPVFNATRTISLPSGKKSMLLKFAVLDYTLPQANTIEYKLDGWENKWFKTENKNIRYSNLTPGKYTLLIRAINSSDVKSAVAKFRILVMPPFWKTFPFIALVFLLFATAIVLSTISISQRKLKAKLAIYQGQKELENERQRISREMHDDIGAGLTQITLMSESFNNHRLKKTKELTDIAETSRKLVENMSEIIWSMNPANSTLDVFFAYLRESLYKLLEYSGMEYKICLPDNFGDIVLNTEQKRNLLLIVKETVHNAVKYSRATEIIVEAELKDKGLKFLISDNGIGFDTNKQTNGNGFNNIKKRISDLNGVFSATSVINKGSSFTFLIPLKSHS